MKTELIKKVIEQIKKDFEGGTQEPLEVLLNKCTEEDLKSFLPEIAQ